MPTAPRFDRETLALLDRAREVELETTALDGERAHRTIIWIVVDGEEAFVRSVRGPAGRWYREISRRPEATLLVGARRLAVTAVPAIDPGAVQRVSEALGTKYGRRSASTASMLRHHTLETTLRLDPR